MAVASSGWMRDPQYVCKLLWSLAALQPLPGSPTEGVIAEWLGALQLELVTGRPARMEPGAGAAAAMAVAGGQEGIQGLAAVVDAEQRQQEQQQEQPGPPYVASVGAAGKPFANQQPPVLGGQRQRAGWVLTPATSAASALEAPAQPSVATPAAESEQEAVPCPLSPSHCTMLLLGLARLQHPSLIHPQLMPYWLQQAAAAMPSAAAGELAGWGWALGRLRYRPDAAWLKAYLGAVAARRRELDPQEMVMVLWGLARLQVRGEQGGAAGLASGVVWCWQVTLVRLPVGRLGWHG